MSSKIRQKITRILNIPQAECDKYFAYSKATINLSAKQFFTKEGSICSKMAFVDEGILRMYYIAEGGKEINVQFFFENDFVVSYQSFLKQQPGKYFIEAITNSSLITIPYKDIQKAYKESPLWEKFGRLVAEKSYINTQQRAESFMFLTAEERYLALQKRYPAILSKVSIYHIASYLGIERQSLSRIRAKLAHTQKK